MTPTLRSSASVTATSLDGDPWGLFNITIPSGGVFLVLKSKQAQGHATQLGMGWEGLLVRFNPSVQGQWPWICRTQIAGPPRVAVAGAVAS